MHGSTQTSLNETRQRELEAFARQYAREAAATRQSHEDRATKRSGRRAVHTRGVGLLAALFARALPRAR